ncbi:maltase-glucoamylase-like [Culex pipiens pallens]|uniref:maltase-glucoamylase-like n=1 Tax=Culex pipiens pallens TaxID=42434 RepID=UPI001954CBBF|nr:maltase-glucoamylase-like [Culex pipiens pallens]
MGFVIIMQRIVDWIAANKLVTFLGVALFAFFVATIALAVENNDNAAALQSCQDRLYAATTTSTTVPPATTATPDPVTTATPDPTTTTTQEPPASSTEDPGNGRKRRFAEANSWRQMG